MCGLSEQCQRTALTHSNRQCQLKMMGKWKGNTNGYKMINGKKGNIIEPAGGNNSCF